MGLRDTHIHVHVHIDGLVRIEDKIDAVMATIESQGEEMSAELDRLTTDVANLRTVEDSAITLLQGLAAQIRDNANDPAALTALADSLEADTADLSAAITANTTP